MNGNEHRSVAAGLHRKSHPRAAVGRQQRRWATKNLFESSMKLLCGERAKLNPVVADGGSGGRRRRGRRGSCVRRCGRCGGWNRWHCCRLRGEYRGRLGHTQWAILSLRQHHQLGLAWRCACAVRLRSAGTITLAAKATAANPATEVSRRCRAKTAAPPVTSSETCERGAAHRQRGAAPPHNRNNRQSLTRRCRKILLPRGAPAGTAGLRKARGGGHMR